MCNTSSKAEAIVRPVKMPGLKQKSLTTYQESKGPVLGSTKCQNRNGTTISKTFKRWGLPSILLQALWFRDFDLWASHGRRRLIVSLPQERTIHTAAAATTATLAVPEVVAGVKHRNTVMTCFSTDDKRIVETTDMGAHKHGMDMHQREGK